MAKEWWRSKTVWVNVLVLVGMVVAGRFMDATQWAEVSAAVLAILNIILRFATNEPISK